MTSGFSVDDPFGLRTHHDENGNMIGYSVPGFPKGSMLHYDAEGNYIGRTDPGLFGTQIHIDKNGKVVGSTIDGFFGQKLSSFTNGNHTSSSTIGHVTFGGLDIDAFKDDTPEDEPFWPDFS